jgi:hypothetical protein
MNGRTTTVTEEATNPSQNGTDLNGINEPVLPYINKYKGFAKAGAEGVIEQCRMLVGAEDVLGKRYFKMFCDEINLDPKSSTFRKLKAIGDKAHRLIVAVDKMPNSWTTLYELARLDADVFDRLVTSDILRPSTTAAEIQTALRGPKSKQAGATGGLTSKAETTQTFFRVHLTPLVDGSQFEFLTAVKEVADKHGVTIELPKPLQKLLEKHLQKKAPLDGFLSEAA